jgi:hypothetical protein
MVSLTQIFNWFKTGLKPTETQFKDTFSSFWHKGERIPASRIEDGFVEIASPGSTIVLPAQATFVRVKCDAGGVYDVVLHSDRAELIDVYVIFTNATASPATVNVDAAYLSAAGGYEFEVPAASGDKPGVFEMNLLKDADGEVFFLTS